MTTQGTIRVLTDPSLGGPTNMARDEALLVRVGALESPPTLRLYQWDTPTISLGYFQPYAAYQSLDEPVSLLPVVRRLTGGGAILHDLELTYSLALPIQHDLVSGKPNRLYELAHDAVIASLAALGVRAERCGYTDDSSPARGPVFCFARRHCYDVLCDEWKITGSAQRRTRDAILQHGSIVLAGRFAQQPTVDLSIPFKQLADQLRSLFPKHLERMMGESMRPAEWTADELQLVHDLTAKYSGAEWTQRF